MTIDFDEADILALQQEAAQAGDDATVADCRAVLTLDRATSEWLAAAKRIARVLFNARANG